MANDEKQAQERIVGQFYIAHDGHGAFTLTRHADGTRVYVCPCGAELKVENYPHG